MAVKPTMNAEDKNTVLTAKNVGLETVFSVRLTQAFGQSHDSSFINQSFNFEVVKRPYEVFGQNDNNAIYSR